MIYAPDEDSYLLREFVKKFSKDKKVLDVGSGSGILAESATSSGAKKVLCVDIDKESVEKLKEKGLNAVKSDLFSNVKGKFDLIVFNPPYLPFDSREDLESSMATTGGKEGDEIIIRFLNEAGDYLEDEGKILVVLSSLTPRKRIEMVLKENKLVKKVLAKKKIFMEVLEVWEVKKTKLKRAFLLGKR